MKNVNEIPCYYNNKYIITIFTDDAWLWDMCMYDSVVLDSNCFADDTGFTYVPTC